MGVLFGRRGRVTVDTIKIDSRPNETTPKPLRVSFDVTKTLDGKPNKATVTVWNLNPNHRAQLSGLAQVPCMIEAGYGTAISTVFLGNLRAAISNKEGPDWKTVMTAGDGEVAVQTARVNVSIAKGTDTDKVLQTLAKALGVKDGNLAQAAQTIRTKFSGTGNIFTAGTVLSGLAAAEMSRICRSLDLEWSIQDGKLQILERGQALAGKAILLGTNLERFGHHGSGGMIGSPTIAIDSKDKRQTVSGKMSMQEDVFPGRLLVIQSLAVSGQFRLEETHHVGDTDSTVGAAWSIDYKAKRY